MADQVIMFEGQEHHFPSDFTDADIAKALGSAAPRQTVAGVPITNPQSTDVMEQIGYPHNSVLGTAAHILGSPFTSVLGIPGQIMDFIRRGGHPAPSLPMGYDEPVTQAYGNALMSLAPGVEGPSLGGLKGAAAGAYGAVKEIPMVGKIIKIPEAVYKGYQTGANPPLDITPFPKGKGTGVKYGGPTDPGYSAPPISHPTGWKPPESPLIPLTPPPEEIVPKASEPFRPNPRILKNIRGGRPSTETGMPSNVSGRVTPRKGWAGPPEESGVPSISPIVTPAGTPQPAATDLEAPLGTVTIPPVAGRPTRYNEMAVKGGGALQDMTYAKDIKIASNLRQEGVTPEKWMSWDDDTRDAYARKLGYKAFGKGGKLGRQTHAEGAKDVFDRLSGMWER